VTGPYQRVLVTGASGYLGTYLVRDLLEQGREVIGLDVRVRAPVLRFVLGPLIEHYVHEEGSVEDRGRLAEVMARHRPTAIVHAAAIVDAGWLRTNPLPAARVNFGGTLNVLEAARLHEVARVLLVSSIGVLPTVRQDPIRPDHPLILESEGSGSGFYGAAKAASEAFGFAYQSGFGLDFRVIRPSAPYGLGMGWPMFIKPMVEGAVRGEPVHFETGGTYPRAYTHVEDITSLTAAVLDAPDESDHVFYGSNGGPLVTASEVARAVQEVVPGAHVTIGRGARRERPLRAQHPGPPRHLERGQSAGLAAGLPGYPRGRRRVRRALPGVPGLGADGGCRVSWWRRFSLDGRVVLLTGAGGGIGRVFAAALASAGARVAAHERTLEALGPALEVATAEGVALDPFAADLASVTACRALVEAVREHFGRIDILVNCAATNARLPITELDELTWERVMAVNVKAPYFLSQAVHPIMRDGGGGVIVNIGSLNIAYGLDKVSVYGLGKAAIAQFTRAAAVESAPDRVRVNCLVPGFIITPMNEEALWRQPRRRAWILDRVPMARPGRADDLVGALLFLASDASAFMTGQTLVVDGGFLAGGSWDYQGPWRDEGRGSDR
jgi:2-deoxy-D-gluconate 3-dehydrogenase